MTTRTNPALPYRFLVYFSVMALSFLLMGGIGIYFVKKVDAEYSEIVDKQLPALNLMRSITKESGAGKRMLELYAGRSSSAHAEALKVKMTGSGARNQGNLKRLSAQLSGQTEQELFGEIMLTRHSYRVEAEKLLSLLDQAGSAGDLVGLNISVNLAFDAYSNAQDRLASFLEKNCQERSDAASEKSNRTMVFFAVFAAWPILMGLVLFINGFVTTAVVFYRYR